MTEAESKDGGLWAVAVEGDVMVPMRDGVRLATDIYRPATGEGLLAQGPFPVILERTPYDKRASGIRSSITAKDPRPRSRAETARWFAARGYVVAVQDCRGRYGSEGVFTKYIGEAEDGYDTVEWLARQAWCDGKVGTMGLSYNAHTQAALACLDPPALAAMVMDSGGFSNAYGGGIRQGGAFELKQLTWAFKHARLSPAAKADPLVAAALDAQDIAAWFTRLPWRPGHSPISAVPEYEDYLLEQWTSGDFGDYWKKLGLWAAGHYDRFADVPLIILSSWYDPYPRTATENYSGLSALGKGPLRLVLGPWTHGNRSLTYSGDVDFGPDATLDGSLAPDFDEFRLRWFDRWLRMIENGVDAEPKVRYFRMGGGSGQRNPAGRMDHGGAWKAGADWPLPSTLPLALYLGPDGRLEHSPPSRESASLSWRHDPERPVPTIGGAITSGEPVMVGGAFDQVEDARFFGCKPPFLPLDSRPDVLVFETAPLEADLEVTGPIQARLWISSDCPDTDFTIKLVDVYPANADYPRGFCMNITDGILRARYRDSWEEPRLMEPGRSYEVLVETFPTSNLFVKGHRIRLDLASSNFPRFDVNPNSGEAEGMGRLPRVATNTVFMDRGRPSCLVLPVIR